jgi:butyryl-CoA dehydrogenase
VEQTIEEGRAFERLASHADALELALGTLKEITTHLTGVAAEGRIDLFLADATLYLEFFGIIAIAWQWLVQAIQAQKALERDLLEAEANFYTGKLYTCRYFFSYELPKIEGLARRLSECDGLTVEMKEAFFMD